MSNLHQGATPNQQAPPNPTPFKRKRIPSQGANLQVSCKKAQKQLDNDGINLDNKKLLSNNFEKIGAENPPCKSLQTEDPYSLESYSRFPQGMGNQLYLKKQEGEIDNTPKPPPSETAYHFECKQAERVQSFSSSEQFFTSKHFLSLSPFGRY